MAMAIEQRVGWGGGPGWSGIGGVSGHCQRVPLPCLGFVWGRCLSTMTCLLTSVGLSETAFSRGTSRGKTVVAETFGVLGPLLWNISYDWMLGGDLTPGRQCDLLRRRHIGDCPGSDPRSGCPSCHDSVLTWILTVAEVVGSCYRLVGLLGLRVARCVFMSLDGRRSGVRLEVESNVEYYFGLILDIIYMELPWALHSHGPSDRLMGADGRCFKADVA